MRWWVRTGALLMIIGVLRLAGAVRTRWEPVSLLAGAVLAAVGYLVPSVSVVFLLGLLVLCVVLVIGIRQQRGHGPAD